MTYVDHAEWGTKRICANCAAKFYDLKHVPIICPKCQTEFVEIIRPKPAASSSAKMQWGRAAGRSGRALPINEISTEPSAAAEESEDEDEGEKADEDGEELKAIGDDDGEIETIEPGDETEENQ